MGSSDDLFDAVYIQYCFKVCAKFIVKAAGTDWLVNPRLSITSDWILTKYCIAKPTLFTIFGKVFAASAIIISELLGNVCRRIFFCLSRMIYG